MARISDAIYSVLSTHAGLAALVGTRISPEARLASAPSLPAVTYDVVDTNYIEQLGAKPGGAVATVNFLCWAATDTGAEDVDAQLYAALEHYAGMAGGVTIFWARATERSQTAERVAPDKPVWATANTYQIHYYI